MWNYEQQRQLQQSCNRGTNDVVGVSPGATGEEGQQAREGKELRLESDPEHITRMHRWYESFGTVLNNSALV